MTVGHPFVVNVVELRRVVGNQRAIELEEPVADVALPSCRVELGSPLRVDLLLETISGGISATGRISGRWHGECRRCLEPVTGDLDIEVAETFEERFTEGETYAIEGDAIDLEPMIRELAILGLPINPVCRDDCAGPVPELLPVTVESDHDAGGRALDPRWAALDSLRPAPDDLADAEADAEAGATTDD